MYTCHLAVLADNVIRDAVRNTITIVDLLEDVIVESFPIVFPRIIALWILERDLDDPEEFTGELIFQLDANELNKFAVGGNFKGKSRTRLIMTIGAFPLPNAGNLIAKFVVNDVELGRYEVQINSTGQPQIEATTG